MSQLSDSLRNRASFQDRMRLSKVYIDDFVYPGRRRYGVWVAPDINMDDYDEYMVLQSDLMRPDLIAYKYYNDVSLWWVICLVNGMTNPLDDTDGLSVGMILKIPKQNAIIEAFSGVNS